MLLFRPTGLIFIAGKDARLRAYDEDTGNVLWTFDLPAGAEGIPAMYEVNGQQYLMIGATSRPIVGGKLGPGPNTPDPTEGSQLPKGYIAIALPPKK